MKGTTSRSSCLETAPTAWNPYGISEHLALPIDSHYLVQRISTLTELDVQPIRLDPRQPIDTNVRVSCASWQQFVDLYTKDISRGGMFVATATPAPLLSAVEIEIMTPGAETCVQINAVVAHIVSTERAQRRGGCPGMGLRFISLDDTQTQAIQELLDRARSTHLDDDADIAGATEENPAVQSIPTTSTDTVEEPRIDPEEIQLRQGLLAEVERLKERTCYERLGLPPDAQQAEIKRAFRKLSKRFHPDRFLRYVHPDIPQLAQEVYLLYSDAEKMMLRGKMTGGIGYKTTMSRPRIELSPRGVGRAMTEPAPSIAASTPPANVVTHAPLESADAGETADYKTALRALHNNVMGMPYQPSRNW